MKTWIELAFRLPGDEEVHRAHLTERFQVQEMGPLVVHLGIMDRSGIWCVTHRLSGLRLAHCLEESDAKLVAEHLNDDRFIQSMGAATREGILDNMPMQLYQWLKACNTASAFVEPE